MKVSGIWAYLKWASQKQTYLQLPDFAKKKKGGSFYFMPLMKHCRKWWMCSDSPPHFPQRGFCQPNLALTILLRDTKLFLIVFFSCHMPLPAIAHSWYRYLASLLLSNDVHVKADFQSYPWMHRWRLFYPPAASLKNGNWEFLRKRHHGNCPINGEARNRRKIDSVHNDKGSKSFAAFNS